MRLIFLVAGIGLFAYLFVQLGPGVVLPMLGRTGWSGVPIALAYAIYQILRARALIACVTSGRRVPGAWVRE